MNPLIPLSEVNPDIPRSDYEIIYPDDYPMNIMRGMSDATNWQRSGRIPKNTRIMARLKDKSK